MLRRESAILAGVGTTRRKFTVIDEATDMNGNVEVKYVRIPIHRYTTTGSGKLCQGTVNHKCLFNKDDTLDLLCPETVQSNGRATVLVHRAFKNREILVQRDIRTYMKLLCFKTAGLAEFRVVCTGRAMLGGCEECVCIQPVEGTYLWVDKRLVSYASTPDYNDNGNRSNESTEQRCTEGKSDCEYKIDKERVGDEGGKNKGFICGEEDGKDERENKDIKRDSVTVPNEQDEYECYDYLPEMLYGEDWMNGVGCQVYTVGDDCKIMSSNP